MDWLLTTITWYFPLFTLGIIFFPLVRKLFPMFVDQGYAFSKTIAILLVSYVMFILGILKIAPFTQPILMGLIAFLSLGGYILSKKYFAKSQFSTQNKFFIALEEGLFLVSLLFLTYVRGQEPSIHGLEKYMDFGFINSILRGTYFPPLDIWLSADPTHPNGYPINYYYFGHLTGAFLIKLSGIAPSIGYNLILATIFAQGTTLAFSLIANILNFFKKTSTFALTLYGIIGSYIVNLGGNLHTIYLLTKGYPNDNPIPFWSILSLDNIFKLFSGQNPGNYWYPNATRFIPFTIHEFPSYSYVVADLHGHVFDIPFVLLTLTLLFVIYIKITGNKATKHLKSSKSKVDRSFFTSFRTAINSKLLIISALLIGFMTAIHYMTNAFDGPIYMLLAFLVFLFAYGASLKFLLVSGLSAIFFLLFSLPFTAYFDPFVSGVGVNCAPSFLLSHKSIGPFLFEQGNCQVSPFWMLFILWGFFVVNFFLFLLRRYLAPSADQKAKLVENLLFIFFAFGIFLILIPEFFYIKDIYPAHFRANTMFKLGYQAFIMMGIASIVSFALMVRQGFLTYVFKGIFALFFFFVFIYPFYAFPSYYGDLKKTPQLDGILWLANQQSQDLEIINYLNKNITGQPVVLESQGDSYSEHERISAYTGLPTVAGWWVHEWLWRGSPEVVGKRIPDVTQIYESSDPKITQELLKKYQVKYIVVSQLEREKYQNLSENKFSIVGTRIFESSNKFGALYKVK